MLVWIESALTPQEVRDCIMDPESDFQRKMVEYLESVHKGKFLDGDMESVAAQVQEQKVKDPFRTPSTETLPAVSYLLRCNHDVTSLMSGTTIKSVIAYVADYITKTPLKTHIMFQSVQKVFER
ncbi:hypothetical protein L227DRAFT_481424, partial [Lentinus tigrinus ALCF2SS1-6]